MSGTEHEERYFEVAVAWHATVHGLQVGQVMAKSEEEAKKKVKEDPWGELDYPWPEDYDDHDGVQFDFIEWCG